MGSVETKAGGRNYSIDLLRLVAMFYVVILHSLGYGGVLGGEGASRLLSYSMETWAFCAVDCFALISGFVAFREDRQERYRFSSYFNLYLQVVFYGLLVTAVYRILGNENADLRQLVRSFFPVYTDMYWYFTAYTGLFFLMPLINAGVQKIDRRLAGKCAVVILFVFVFCATFYDLHADRFVLTSGYSLVWLIILYTLGALLKKSGLPGAHRLGPMWIINVLLLAVTAYLASQENMMLMTYISFSVVFSALCHIALFARLRLPRRAEAIVKFAAPGAFAVYLLNTHPLFWTQFMAGRFQHLQGGSPAAIFLTVTGFALLFVICAVLIDAVRQRLFCALRIPKLTSWADQKLNAALDRVFSGIGA